MQDLFLFVMPQLAKLLETKLRQWLLSTNGCQWSLHQENPFIVPNACKCFKNTRTLSGIKQHLWYSTFCFYYNNIVLNIMVYVAPIFFTLVSFHGFWLDGEPFLSINKFHIPNYRKCPFGVALSLVTLICIIVIWLFKGELLGSYFHMELFFFSCYPIWLCCEFGTRWKQVHKFPIIVRFTDFYVGCVAVSLAFFLFSAPDNNNIQETRTLEITQK